MTAHLWQLRADVQPLEEGARRWARLAGDLATTADDIVGAARHALDQGWESEAAESYEAHRRRMVRQIDTFTTVAGRLGGSLTALAGLLTAAQEELDRAWVPVAVVPHELVGSTQVLVLHPASAADEELVRSASDAARAIRGRLEIQLDAESARLREATMELASVRSELVQIVGGEWPVGVLAEVGDLGENRPDPAGGTPWGTIAGVGTAGSASVAGAAAGGTAAGAAAAGGVSATPVLPAVAPVSFSAPDLTGLSAAALAAGTGLVAGAAARRGRKQEPTPSEGSGMAPMGGMAAGAAMRGSGTLGRPGGSGGSGGSGGAPRAGKPRPAEQESAQERVARAARERDEAREAKRRLIAERQAERAARRAQRDESQAQEPPVAVEAVQVVPGEDAPPRRE